MTNEEKYEYWLDTAQYDIDTADAMLKSGRWLYVVFMCQQAIEKLCKGLYILYIDDNVPRIHAIRQLVDRFSDKIHDPVGVERYALFDRLSSFYIEGRYTDYKEKLSSAIDKQEAKAILTQTKEAFAWLLTLKP
jgi:HEPN domain-containing protein